MADISTPIDEPTALDRELAPVMFLGSLIFLGLLSVLLHLGWGEDLSSHQTATCLTTLGIVYLIFPVEVFLHWFRGGRITRQHLWAVFLPPFRMAVADHALQRQVWFPMFGWRRIEPTLERSLHNWFSLPMMGMALFVLPLIVGEYVWSDRIESERWLRVSFEGSTALIWSAFVIEFVVMFSITPNKKRYLIRNWIDVFVIILPMIAFLRSLRMARVLRLNQLTRTVRLYRMRGVILRTWRAIVALDMIERFLIRDPHERIARLEEAHREKAEELSQIRQKIDALRSQVEQVNVLVPISDQVQARRAGDVPSNSTYRRSA